MFKVNNELKKSIYAISITKILPSEQLQGKQVKFLS